MDGSYAELQCQSAFSFLRGASEPEALVQRAVELGYRALALTDRDGLYGNPRFHQACKDAGLHAVHGTTLTLRRGVARVRDEDGTPATADDRVTLLAEDDAGWSALCRLVSAARHRSRTAPVTPVESLAQEARGLIALVGPHVPEETLGLLHEAFGKERLALAVHDRLLHRDRRGQELQRRRAARHGLPLVVTGGARFARRQDKRVHDVLACVRHGLTLDGAATRLLPNAEFCLRPVGEIERLFRHDPGALRRSVELARRCSFSMSRLQYVFPRFDVEAGQTHHERLRALVQAGARERYGTPGEKERRQLREELDLIAKMDLAGYFLLVHDIVRFCREQDILCQGRGSAANSVVCYVLGITSVDPVRMGLLFARFLSENREELPDVDIDIEHARREEVIQYVYRRYGRKHAALCGTVISYRSRSAVRDAGKALGLSLAEVDRLAGSLDRQWDGDSGEMPPEWGARGSDPRLQHLLRVAGALEGLPRHISTHVGGMVLTGPPLNDVMPTEPAAMEGRTIVPWDKDDLAALRIMKIDLLGLGMLTALAKSFRLVNAFTPPPRPLELHTVPVDDAPTWEMLCRADTVGVFQVESRAQMNCLPRLRPQRFYDLVVEVALIRPGPIQGDMVHPYLRRHAGREPVTYAHPLLEPILERTCGVPLFQEQGMRIAMEVGGFSGAEADELRRAMGHKRSRARMAALSERLIGGLMARGIERPYAERIYKQLLAFADFGFPESHAASFARLAWASSWLKQQHPAAFLCALLNSQPMGFYAPAVLVSDAQRHGVLVLPVDVLQSDWDCTLQWVEAGTPGVSGGGDAGVADERVPLLRESAVRESAVRESAAPWDPAPAWSAGAGSMGAPDGSRSRVAESRSMASAEDAPGDQSDEAAPDYTAGENIRGAAPGRRAAARKVDEPWKRTGSPPRGLRRPVLGVRLGLQLVRGLGEKHADGVRAGLRSVLERGPFVSPEDFARRTGVSAAVMEHLARLGALAGFEERRRHALWRVALMARRVPGPLAEPLRPDLDDDVVLPALPEEEAVRENYRMAGVSVERHPLELLRPRLAAAGVLPARELLARGPALRDRTVRVAGLCICRQRPPTAGGLTFLSLEDETGFANLIVMPAVAKRDREGLRATIVLGTGRVEFADGVVNIKAERLESLDDVQQLDGVQRHDYR